jgi:hypothetical protein
MASTIQFDTWQSTAGVLRSTVLQTKYVSSTTRTSNTVSGSFTEPSSAYRVTITPFYSNSLIIVNYYVPVNIASASNILQVWRAFRITGGTTFTNLTSSGVTNGSRLVVAGGVLRPGNGFDSNDHNMIAWQVLDLPGSTAAHTYGFQHNPEGGHTTYFGYSGSNNGSWGFDSNIVIVAQEIAQ